MLHPTPRAGDTLTARGAGEHQSVRQTYQERACDSEIQNARTQAAKIAAAVLAGQLSPVLSAIDLNGLRSSVDVPDDDPDFEIRSPDELFHEP